MDSIKNTKASGNISYGAGAAVVMNKKIEPQLTAGVATIMDNIGKNPVQKSKIEEIELTVEEEQAEEISRKIDGSHSPGTTDEAYEAKAYKFTDAEYKQLVALVYAEAAENDDYITSDTMGVTSVLLNRLESPDFPNTIEKIITADGEFEGYKSERYVNAMKSNLEVVPSAMLEAIDRVLDGQRNTDRCFFNSSGTNSRYNKYTVSWK